MPPDTDILGERVAALFIDLLLAGAAVLLAAAILVPFFGGVQHVGAATQSIVGVLGIAVFLVVFTLPFGGYWFIAEGWTGTTIGKHVFDLCVVTEDGTQITWKHSLIRNVLRPVDMTAGFGVPYLVGCILVFATENHQRLGDLAADTYVTHQSR